MKFKNKKILELKSIVRWPTTVDWIINNHCNFKCSYCFPYANSNNISVKKFDEVVKNNLSHLINELKSNENENLRFLISGGEPTADEKIVDILKFLKLKNILVELVTNGSKSLQWWEENYLYIEILSISYHLEFSKYEHILKIVKFLSNKISKVRIYVMVTQPEFDLCIKLYQNFVEDLKNFKVDINIKLIRYNFSDIKYEYTKEQLYILEALLVKNKSHFSNPGEYFYYLEDNTKVGVNFITRKYIQGSWLNYECSAHRTFLNIFKNGDIGTLNCGTKYIETCNIYEDSFISKFSLNKDNIICKTGICGCIGLDHADKIWRDKPSTDITGVENS